jgi:hypothetical protein
VDPTVVEERARDVNPTTVRQAIRDLPVWTRRQSGRRSVRMGRLWRHGGGAGLEWLRSRHVGDRKRIVARVRVWGRHTIKKKNSSNGRG